MIVRPSKIAQIHTLQKLVLEAIYLIYAEMSDHVKVSREYRDNLPLEDRQELSDGFSGIPILVFF
jgi:hypothetical protein